MTYRTREELAETAPDVSDVIDMIADILHGGGRFTGRVDMSVPCTVGSANGLQRLHTGS